MASIAFSFYFSFILVSTLLTKAAAVRPVPLPPDSKMSLGYKPIAGNDMLADSKLSVRGFDHSMLPKMPLDYNPIVPLPSVAPPPAAASSEEMPSQSPSPLETTRFLPSPSPYVVEREPPSKPAPPSCRPNC